MKMFGNTFKVAIKLQKQSLKHFIMDSWCITDGPSEYIVIKVVASKVISLKSSVKSLKSRNHVLLLTIQKVMLKWKSLSL